MMPREDIVAIYQQGGLDAVVDLVQNLSAQIDDQQQMIALLTQRLNELEDRLAKNSRNSSKPPSSDDGGSGKPKPKSRRSKSSKKPGGQKGHPGTTLSLVENPDHVVVHFPKECEGCGGPLCSSWEEDGSEEEASCYERRRQVVDLPPLALEVTEHRARRKRCSGCGQSTTAEFPPEASVRGVSYGPRIKALSVYLMGYQLLPYERASELLFDLFGAPAPGVGTLHSATKSCFEGVKETEEAIKEGVSRAQVANFDETGLRVGGGGKGMWVHVASTSSLTHYAVHQKRGSEATQEIGILPSFGGVAVHDGWRSYRHYERCAHALCNAHHLRELTFIEEEHEQEWAGGMKTLLMEIEESVREEAAKGGRRLAPEQVEKFERRYQQLLKAGLEANPSPPESEQTGEKKKRGPPKQSKGKNLVERLGKHQEAVLRFMYDFRVPLGFPR
jgi:transposase/uncharacterized coiled-coil protein SlyX